MMMKKNRENLSMFLVSYQSDHVFPDTILELLN